MSQHESESAGGGRNVVPAEAFRRTDNLTRTWSPTGNSVSDRIDLAQLLNILRERFPFIIAFAAIVLVAVVGATMVSHMRFKARGSLYLGELQSAGPQSAGTQPDQFDFLGGRGGDVGTEI